MLPDDLGLIDSLLILSVINLMAWSIVAGKTIMLLAEANGNRPFIAVTLELASIFLVVSFLLVYSSVYAEGLHPHQIVPVFGTRLLSLLACASLWRLHQKAANLKEH